MSNPFSQKAGVKKKIRRSAIPSQRSKPGSTQVTSLQTTNPWSLAVRGTKPSSISTRETSGRSGSPSGGLRRVGGARRKQTTSGKPRCDTSNLATGQKVLLTWEIDRAFGTGTGMFVGEVTALDDDWITVVDSSGVIFHYPVAVLSDVKPA